MRRPSVDCSAISFVFLASVVELTAARGGLPQRPQTAATVFWSDSADPLDGMDELESSSDDWSDWMTGADSTVKEPATITSSESLDKAKASVNMETEQVTKGQPIDYQSQPLKTLEKLQQMLDDTDYMTAAKSKQRLVAAAPTSSKQRSTPFSALSSPSTAKQEARANPMLVPVIVSKEHGNASILKSTTESQQTSSRNQSSAPADQLWQSKDRARYKRQQLRLRRSLVAQEQASIVDSPSPALSNQRRPLVAQEQISTVAPPPLTLLNQQSAHVASSDDEVSDDTDDGLGYSLPNLPVYYSDAEVDSEDQESDPLQRAPLEHQRPQGPPMLVTKTGYQPPPPPQHHSHFPPDQNHYPYTGHAQQANNQPPIYSAPQQQQQQQYYPPPPLGYPQEPPPPEAYRQHYPPLPPQYHPYHFPPGYPYAYSPFTPHALAQHPAPAGQYIPRHDHNDGHLAAPSQPHIKKQAAPVSVAETAKPVTIIEPERADSMIQEISLQVVPTPNVFPPPVFNALYPQYPVDLSLKTTESPQSLAEASAKLSLEATFKLSLLMMTVAVACYSGVSPRTLPLSEYNMQFYDSIRLVSLSMIVPLITVLSVFDARENDVNAWINTFFVSSTFGYALAFAVEIVLTTLVRLGVFCWFEPNVFAFTPKVPVPVLPWVLREIGYRPKRITLFAADVAASCIAAPIIEELVKLKLLEWTTTLPKNFRWGTRESKRSKKKRKHAEPIVRGPGQTDVINANKYVCQMLAVSLGMKLCDSGRRILMYTKSHNHNKSFYAICRGLFPIHELCGTMTALALAKRDLLGVEYKTWQILAPAVIVHAMANFRGMKPFFKWNASTPWSEMQLSPVNVADPSTLFQLMKKGYAKMMWLIILGRVLGYSMKNYYLINRQALKRTTTYAGKHAAFSAELATAEVLKKQKQKQN